MTGEETTGDQLVCLEETEEADFVEQRSNTAADTPVDIPHVEQDSGKANTAANADPAQGSGEAMRGVDDRVGQSFGEELIVRVDDPVAQGSGEVSTGGATNTVKQGFEAVNNADLVVGQDSGKMNIQSEVNSDEGSSGAKPMKRELAKLTDCLSHNEKVSGKRPRH